ncbi:unnamed protein product [Prorocentrum cordatum]|uniref:Uncharacterized protein n=1 Tax=Prorocentrum cordatum TaxID=2364126 RepID=A0ABN9VQR4_9DINO|nr:unnamed protein product [Polarella glacialis]
MRGNREQRPGSGKDLDLATRRHEKHCQNERGEAGSTMYPLGLRSPRASRQGPGASARPARNPHAGSGEPGGGRRGPLPRARAPPWACSPGPPSRPPPRRGGEARRSEERGGGGGEEEEEEEAAGLAQEHPSPGGAWRGPSEAPSRPEPWGRGTAALSMMALGSAATAVVSRSSTIAHCRCSPVSHALSPAV